MATSVLFATDGSEFSNRALRYIQTMLDPDSVTIHVTTVAKDLPQELKVAAPRSMEPGELEEKMTVKAREIAEEAAETLREEGFDVEIQTPVGHPGEEICERAWELDVDQIIMGKRGRSEVRELILGSTSQYVLHHADCAVTIFPENT